VVNVSVAQDDAIDSRGRKREAAIAISRLVATALKQAAIQKNPSIAVPQLMHRPGDCACGAPKMDFHA
jgi:hypothetical protein